MNKSMKKAVVVLLLLAGGFTAPVNAAVGADDALLLAKVTAQLKQLQKQYKLLNNTYSLADKQMKSTEKLVNLNQGHSGFGGLYNGTLDLRQRESANSWRETLKGVSGGNQARYTELVRAYEKQHASLDKTTFSQGATPARTTRFASEKEVTQAVSIESEAALNDINDALKRIHDLSDQIEKAETTKAALDLNTRMLTEIAYLSVQNMKAQALLNQQIAMKSGSSLADEAALSNYLSP